MANFDSDTLTTMGDEFGIHEFHAGWAAGVASLCAELGWHSYADVRVAERGLSAPGVHAFVAVVDQTVVGFAQVLSDGVVQAFYRSFPFRETFGFRIYPDSSM